MFVSQWTFPLNIDLPSSINIYLSIFADDVVDDADTAGRFQSIILGNYCDKWGMYINLRRKKNVFLEL